MDGEPHFYNKFSDEYYHSANSINGFSCYQIWVREDEDKVGRNDILTGNL